jgi:hypothetical protein
MGRASRWIWWGAAALFCLLIAGCQPLPELIPSLIPELAPAFADSEATRTPNPTLLAIADMLTETRAAPTITPTWRITATPTRTITPTRPVVGRPGEKIEAGGMELILLSQQTETVIDRSKSGAGQVFLSIEVVLANTSDQAQEYYPMFFRLVGPGGTEYEPFNIALWPALQGGTLSPGEFTRGFIAFRIPEEAPRLRLRYRNSIQPDAFPPLWVDLSKPIASRTPVLPVTGGLPRKLPGVGQRVEAAGVALTFNQVTAGTRLQRTRAAKGRIFVDLLVTIQNLSHPDTPYNPFYFKAKDALGYEYVPVVIAHDSLLHPGSLGNGQKVSGHVFFEVPEGTEWLVVSYLPQVLVENYEEILLGIEVPTPK